MSLDFNSDLVGESVDLFLSLRKTTCMSELNCKYWLQYKPFYDKFSEYMQICTGNPDFFVVANILRSLVSEMFSDKDLRKSIPHSGNMISGVKSHCKINVFDDGWLDNSEPIDQESLEEVSKIGNELDE